MNQSVKRPDSGHVSASSSFGGTAVICDCNHLLFMQLSKLRRNEFTLDPDNFTVLTPGDRMVWARLFAEYFLCGSHCTIPHCSEQSDDMLWYCRPQSYYNHVVAGRPGNIVDVYRKGSKNQPVPGDSNVDWEESVCLNLVLQKIEYYLTCAVCTKTSPQNLQILKRNTQRVFASPSHRRMDSKGEGEQIAFPNIYFAVDGFEELFQDIVVRDGECVCVELVARDRAHTRESTVFLGSIRYEVLKQVYDTKTSSSWGQWAAQWMTSTSGPNRRLEFVRMRGPHGQGCAEMAVSRVPGQGFETPMQEHELPFDDFEVEAVESYRRRRMSENNLSASVYYRQPPRGSPMKKTKSEADYASQYPEVEAQSIDEELEESVFSRLWGMRGFGQAWHWLREKRRATSTPLNAYLTYVTVPWHVILDDLMEHPKRPVLTFDVEAKSI